MPSLVSVAELKARVGTNLADTDLQDLIDQEEALLNRLYGSAAGPVIEKRLPIRAFVYTKRPITSVTTVKETDDGVETTLAAADYRVWPWGLERVGKSWAELVEITYTPENDTLDRKRVIIELCRLTLAPRGVKSESIGGEYSYTAADYTAEREKLIASLNRDKLYGPR